MHPVYGPFSLLADLNTKTHVKSFHTAYFSAAYN